MSGAAPLVYLIAGEPSGDALGGRLMAALEERSGGVLRFAGIGGERMAEAGLKSLVPLHELAVMGVAEVLPRARRILRRVDETVAEIRRLRPQAVVTIDSSGFTWRVAQRLRAAGERELPLIHYVAPMVWAWRAGRARRMARWYDHLMVLLPFEPPYFTRVGLPCTYVGHPVVESGADRGDGAGFRRRHGIPPDAPLVAVLPGSRRGEVGRLLVPFAGAVAQLAARHKGLRVVVPTTETVAAIVTEAVQGWAAPAIVVSGEREKYDAFAASNAALAASGTVALELALAGVPAVVAYRLNPLTHALLRRMVRVKHIHLLNLILGRAVVPELIQGDCTPERLAGAVDALLSEEPRRRAQIEACREALKQLGLGAESPSRRAADLVLSLMAARPRQAAPNAA
ncbi:MAG TPA: lipid-A-disaccharide synthase [Stellaceae bacterium]|nr:lipid-A-disaccharide synthase [Stellaceae bacterium]